MQARYLSARLVSEGLLAGTLGVSISTDWYAANYVSSIATVRFPRETAYLSTLNRAITDALPRLFEDRERSAKEERLQRVVHVLDERYGRNTTSVGRSAGEGKERLMRQRMKSPAYVTRWAELPRVR